MESSTKNAPKSPRDVAYYRRRYQNRVHAKLVSWLTDEAQRLQITKKEFAERMGKDPALVTRLLSHPGNLTLDTITDLALAFDAEPEPPEIVRFADRATPNYVHPLILRAIAQTPVNEVVPINKAFGTPTQTSSSAPVRVELLPVAAA